MAHPLAACAAIGLAAMTCVSSARAQSRVAASASPPPTTATNAPTLDQLPVFVPTSDPPLGSAAPSMLQQAAPDGHWAVICEAHRDTNHDGRVRLFVNFHRVARGDALEPYLVMNSGPGEVIEDVVDADPSGRWLAFVRSGHLVLRDTNATPAADEDLTARGADAASRNDNEAPNRAGGFDASGRRLLYLRGPTGRGADIVVRDLASRAETVVSGGQGVIFNASFAGDGQWIVANVIRTDTPREARRAASSFSVGVRRCRGSFMPPTSGGAQAGVASALRVARLGRDGTLHALPGTLITGIGDRLLIRRTDDAILAYAADGSVREWAPADCHGVVQAIAPTLDRALVACIHGDEDHAAMEIAGDAGRRPLNIEGESVSREVESQVRVEAAHEIYQGQSGAGHVPSPWVDLATGVVTRPPETIDGIVARSGPFELQQRGGILLLREVRTNTTRPIAVGIAEGCDARGAIVLCGDAVVDVAAGRVLGRLPSQQFAVRADGSALVRVPTDPVNPESDSLPRGQFRWVGAPTANGAAR